MTSRIAERIAELQARFRGAIEAKAAPVCVHDLCTRADLDPRERAAVSAILLFASGLHRPSVGAPASCGRASVQARRPGWFTPSPVDYYYWSLAGGRPGTPDGLATFGAEWQGGLLAAKVVAHGQQYPMLRTPRRGRPDLIV